MGIINPAELDLREESVVKINRTAKVTSRGKRFRFSALVVIGAGFNSIVTTDGNDYFEFLVPGVLGMTILFGALLGSLSMVYEKESGVMRLLVIAPIKRRWVVFAKMAAATVSSFFQVVLLSIILFMIGKLSLGINWPLFFLAVILLISIVAPSSGISISGSILASKYSSSINDFKKSAEYNLNILKSGTKESAFYNDALLYLVASGNFSQAFELSKEMYELKLRSPVLSLVLIIENISNEKLNESMSLIQLFEKDLPPVLIASLRGWINLKKGQLEDSLVEFKKLSETDLKFDLGAYYSAIAYAQSANTEEALKIINNNINNFKILGKDFEIFKTEIMIMNGENVKAQKTLKKSLNDFFNDITLKELYLRTKENNLYDYQIFKDENSGISDTLSLFAQGESRQLNQKLVEVFYYQLAYLQVCYQQRRLWYLVQESKHNSVI